jgi:hypothetical protein
VVVEEGANAFASFADDVLAEVDQVAARRVAHGDAEEGAAGGEARGSVGAG